MNDRKLLKFLRKWTRPDDELAQMIWDKELGNLMESD